MNTAPLIGPDAATPSTAADARLPPAALSGPQSGNFPATLATLLASTPMLSVSVPPTDTVSPGKPPPAQAPVVLAHEPKASIGVPAANLDPSGKLEPAKPPATPDDSLLPNDKVVTARPDQPATPTPTPGGLLPATPLLVATADPIANNQAAPPDAANPAHPAKKDEPVRGQAKGPVSEPTPPPPSAPPAPAPVPATAVALTLPVPPPPAGPAIRDHGPASAEAIDARGQKPAVAPPAPPPPPVAQPLASTNPSSSMPVPTPTPDAAAALTAPVIAAAQAPAAAPPPVPVLAASAPVHTPATPMVSMAQVAPVVVSLASGPTGSHQLVLHLDPPDLGRLEIHVVRAPDASTHVEISAERPATLALLHQDEAALHAALNNAGMPTDGRSLSMHLGQFGGQQAGPQGDGQRGAYARPSGPFGSGEIDGVVRILPPTGTRIARTLLDITA